MGGYLRHFGEMTRDGDVFTAAVFGEDVAGPDGGRFAALETEQHSYVLGRLSDGTYTFTAQSDVQTLATMTITIVNGKAINTPTWQGPYTPTVPFTEMAG